jgi:hypothetical protein
MEDADIPTRPVSDWQPITNKADLAHLGKLGEEICECGASIFRCIIQGIDESEPETGKLNKEWLEDELADVIALAEFAINRFRLDRQRIGLRAAKKTAYKAPWFERLAMQSGER